MQKLTLDLQYFELQITNGNSMLSFFHDRREQKQLMAAFKEQSAIKCWTLIETLKRGEDVLADNPSLFADVTAKLNKGLECGEDNNFRVAGFYYSAALRQVAQAHPVLIRAHPELVEALERAAALSKVIEPLWARHQDKLVTVETSEGREPV
ncbi:hypothetical protein PQR05_24310 [Paraburkholderia sediminicola]|uniref:hypothetical protein n=1 Tax=Paraburkholderia sediminicola TaxID=458836 RepID=UPI0038B7B4B7